jgi:hypothetical protein
LNFILVFLVSDTLILHIRIQSLEESYINYVVMHVLSLENHSVVPLQFALCSCFTVKTCNKGRIKTSGGPMPKDEGGLPEPALGGAGPGAGENSRGMGALSTGGESVHQWGFGACDL